LLRQVKIQDKKTGADHLIFDSPDFEFVNPIDHYSTVFMGVNISMMREIVHRSELSVPNHIVEKIIHKEALKDWNEKYSELDKLELPKGLMHLLAAPSKKEQVRLLKGLCLIPDQLLAFIFRAHLTDGYLFSQNRAEHPQKGLNKEMMPSVVEIKNGKVNKVGNTTFTDGQLKQAVDHRKVTISKFLDKGEEWHCFFLTYDSLKGKESWKNGQPHYHYISDKFGIPREKVVAELKKSKYKLSNLPHIDLNDYPNNKD